ncbi:efflux RND transporter periplasmic adaptor subunit [Echinicola soli]|uniref:Efflux RND transporter periplasmic adaptor subunit n=1 Tax=Echinicola soli TaxID=2591634 RepID=A0A514CNI3_9BACT|nr:efflux RND transporter periplasmic adaptor subunit [Echinicola soli]QDH81274.1 efflux RND transporter periplasmic adaptor subunit [Echinicola soli]
MKKYIYHYSNMKTFSRLSLALAAAMTFSCGPQESELEAKKAQLKAYKDQYHELKDNISALEKEISAEDSTFARSNRKSVLVTTVKAQNQAFEHYLEVTGSVLSKKNVNISSEVSGRIEQIDVHEGMRASKGEVLVSIDGESIDNNISELETQLDLATTLYEKQKRLWEREIGTEVQYLEAKNRVESLEKNLETLKTQKDKTTIRAPYHGTVEEVMVKLGELVQPGMPIINFVGESDLYIEADISEAYVGVLEQGDSVKVQFPSLDREVNTKVTAVGAIINPNNRTFKVEVFLPSVKHIKPNMISVLRIKDYENKAATTVPTNLIQRDNKGEYVFVVDNGQAKKQYITKGETYHRVSEIKEGLSGGEVLIDKGFREVAEGSKVQIVES